jgi:hypothetical protein
MRSEGQRRQLDTPNCHSHRVALSNRIFSAHNGEVTFSCCDGKRSVAGATAVIDAIETVNAVYDNGTHQTHLYR